MDAALIKNYRYHRANGGTAQGSLACARAGILLDAAIDAEVAEVTWEYEQERYEDVFGFESDAERERFYRDLESNTITGPYYCTLRVESEIVGSLGMITLGPRGTDDYYARLVAIELAMEAETDLRQAIGDHRDCATFAGPDLSNYNAHGPLI